MLQDKETKLRKLVENVGKTAVAFSGGADSSLLLKVALEVLGVDNVLVLTSRSCLLKSSELDRASTWTKRNNISGPVRHKFLDADPLSWDDFVTNPDDRCYLCKNRVYRMFIETAEINGFDKLIDGTNLDDMNSSRPGLLTLKELGIGTPLADAGLNKKEVRLLSRKFNLDTWDHPSASCLATRVPSGRTITEERLGLVSSCEAELERFGFNGCRFRLGCHDDSTGYIQVMNNDINRILQTQIFEKIKIALNRFGMERIYFVMDGRH